MKLLPILATALAVLGLQAMNAAEALKVGQEAPAFTLKNQNDKPVSLSDYKDKNIVLVFSRAHW